MARGTWLRRLRPRLPRTRRGRRRALRLAVLVCSLALLPSAWLFATTDGQRIRTPADAPAAPVAVVFGAGLWDGEPSPYLAHRLDAAARLYHDGKVRALLVTGDNSVHGYNEPDAMRDYLTGRGVPADRIVADYAGFDTWDSCARAHDVFGVRRALLVSQDYHIRRALALCRAAGIDAWGVAVREPRDSIWLYGSLREVPGAAKAAFEAFFTPSARFPGPPETSLETALSGPDR
ncbi:ElyC/SanA/YdcF family protein [Streptomyces sp. YIM 98790]|uniref:SanA/YdcF family protein n=1 Tax=Streptomyces sp. YIM 98790 TaxID=2689077 RepID=UPI0028BEF07B|nr:ElyC/SanA/YdcF family protein [Streptomyces sp. YIM 98790]